jgi:hypothetical protein
MIAVAIAFFTGPIGRYVGLALALCALAWGAWSMAERSGREIERSRIERAEKGKANAAKNELDRVNGGDRGRVSGFDRD